MPFAGEPMLFYCGAALCCAAVAHASLGAVGIWRGRQQQRRRCDADAEAFRREVATAVGVARARLANRLAWEGEKPLRIADIVQETPDIKSFYLVDTEGRSLPRYLPGQHLTVRVTLGNQPAVRCYSLSGSHRGEYYRVTVRRLNESELTDETTPGLVSGWLHDHAGIGMELSCGAPRGRFFLDPRDPRPVVLIGAGVGCTPIFAMLEATQAARWKRPVHAFLGFRDQQNRLFGDATRSLRQENPTLNLQTYFSQPLAGASHDETERQGRISIEALKRELPSNKFDFFLCGPPSMMQQLAPELLDWGVADDAIHYEAFGPSSITTIKPSETCDNSIGSAVRFRPGQDPVVWDGEHRSLLDLAESAGVPIASGCRAGNCGMCRVRVIKGATRAVKRPGAPITDDECLACISVPDGPVVLEA